jgi:hypothetical protein
MIEFLKFLLSSLVCGISIAYSGFPRNDQERMWTIYGLIGMIVYTIIYYIAKLILRKKFNIKKTVTYYISVLCGIAGMMLYFLIVYLFFYK